MGLREETSPSEIKRGGAMEERGRERGKEKEEQERERKKSKRGRGIDKLCLN